MGWEKDRVALPRETVPAPAVLVLNTPAIAVPATDKN